MLSQYQRAVYGIRGKVIRNRVRAGEYEKNTEILRRVEVFLLFCFPGLYFDSFLYPVFDGGF